MTAVFNATRADQHVVAATVETIADRVDAQEIVGPCVVLIGEVLREPAITHTPVEVDADEPERKANRTQLIP